MPLHHPLASGLRRGLTVLLGLLTAGLAWAQADPPGRVARLSHLEGRANFALENSGSWTPAEFNRPLTAGDQVATEPGSRAEVHSGSTALHLNGSTWLIFHALDDASTRLELSEGALAMRIRTLFPEERYEVGTAHLNFVASEPGDYRFDVDTAGGTTRLTLHSGSGVAYGRNGETRTLVAPQQIVYHGRPGAFIQSLAEAPRDSFDLWVSVRNHREDQATSARYLSRETVGYQQLDAWGVWITDPLYGPVWQPRTIVADWAPYRYGHWVWISPWGWTWVDDAPWGFAPFHYGRWIQLGLRWTWVPGPVAPRPVYAPALVAFIGISGVSGDISWSLSIGTGGIGVGIGWFPLAPGELWRPAYPVSPRYLGQVNHWLGRSEAPRPPSDYRYQRHPAALTIVPADDFGQLHRYRNRNYTSLQPHVPDRELSRTRAVPPPPRSVLRNGSRSGAAPAIPRLEAPAPALPQPGLAQPPRLRVPPPAAQPAPGRSPAPPAREVQRQREQSPQPQPQLRRMPDERSVQPAPVRREPSPMSPRPAPRSEPQPSPQRPSAPHIERRGPEGERPARNGTGQNGDDRRGLNLGRP